MADAGPRPARGRAAGPRREDRARLAGRGRHRGRRGPHAAAGGLRRRLLHGRGPDRDQRGSRRADDHPRGIARLVQLEPLFVGRWINEGFADEYAARVLDEVSIGGLRPEHGQSPTSDGALDLNEWAHPGRIDDDETDQREHYGYDASWTVVRALLDEIGEDGMREVLAAAECQSDRLSRSGRARDGRLSRTTGAASSISSRRQAAPTDAEETVPALGRHRPSKRRCSSTRREARARVRVAGRRRRGLAARLRRSATRWAAGSSGGRRPRSPRRRAILALRDDIAARAAELAVVPPSSLREAYEGGDGRSPERSRAGYDQLATATDLDAAADLVAAERDVIDLDRADRGGSGRDLDCGGGRLLRRRHGGRGRGCRLRGRADDGRCRCRPDEGARRRARGGRRAGARQAVPSRSTAGGGRASRGVSAVRLGRGSGPGHRFARRAVEHGRSVRYTRRPTAAGADRGSTGRPGTR